MLTHADSDAARTMLQAERALLLGQIEDQSVELAAAEPQATTGMGETDHLVVSEHNELTARVSAVTKASLADVEAALARLDAGTYGDCTSCGSAIAQERLAALPAAAHCVQCQSRRGSPLR